MKFESEETRKKKKNLKEALKKLEGKYGDGIVKKGGKGKILDNHNEICYSYEYKSMLRIIFTYNLWLLSLFVHK